MPRASPWRSEHDWGWWGRPNQQAPRGDWRTWLLLAGRGFGKTRSGAEAAGSRWSRRPQPGDMPALMDEKDRAMAAVHNESAFGF
jgi:phage terminase large subunit-like protein